MTTIPLLAITAFSGTGKTTLLKQLIPFLQQKYDITTAVIKHSHHNIDIDKQGKDSYELRKAGARQTLLACNQRWVLMTETAENNSVDLPFLAKQFDASIIDLILVEGFKDENIAKIALHRSSSTKVFNELIDKYTIAIATDYDLAIDLPLLNINNIPQVADYIYYWLNKQNPL